MSGAAPGGAAGPVEPVLPHYDHGGLAGVLPAVLTSLVDEQPATLTPARRGVVVLVDGLGLELLERRRGHAPFLRSLLGGAERLTAGFPTTTATSMGSFGTGLPPGAHGLTGYQVVDPATGRLFNELNWEDGPDPRAWQPHPTVLERARTLEVTPTMVGPSYFDGSGLTLAALRGANFLAGRTLEDRVAATSSALRASPRALVYLYWGDLDRAGHEHGVESEQWGTELESVDGQLRRLAASLPADTSLTIVADHGMVDVPFDRRIDLAQDAELDSGVDVAAGEMRALHLHARPGAAADVEATWRARVGEQAWIRTREQAVEQGWFGPVEERVMGRIGDLVVAFHDDSAVVDSRLVRPELLGLLGQHGSLTAAEMTIPLLHRPAASAG